MRPSKSATAAPASLTSPKSCATKRQRKPAPLGDVTNLLVVAETPTPSKPRRTARRSLPAPSDVSAVSSACSSSASVTPPPKPSAAASATPLPKPSAATPARKPSSAACVVTPAPKPSSAAYVTPAPKPSSAACVTPGPKPSSAACVTPAPKPSSAAVLEEERSVLKSPTISTVYRRATTETQGRWRRNPTATNSKSKEAVAATASCRPPNGKSARTNNRKKDTRPISASAPCHEGKKKRSIASTPNLLDDLLEKQRAYFADIDAFELVEEEASESELE